MTSRPGRSSFSLRYYCKALATAPATGGIAQRRYLTIAYSRRSLEPDQYFVIGELGARGDDLVLQEVVQKPCRPFVHLGSMPLTQEQSLRSRPARPLH